LKILYFLLGSNKNQFDEVVIQDRVIRARIICISKKSPIHI